jgi:hypothetical protein
VTAPSHLDLMRDAIATEAAAQRALLAGEPGGGRDAFREAARLYRASWEAAPPASYGRLVGMLKAAVLAGDARAEAAYARSQVAEPADSPAAHYALAIAALVEDDDSAALAAAGGMRAGSPAFGRAAGAIAALAAGDADAYRDAVGAIVADFEGRDEHLTGVPIADTALMLERLAAARGMAARPASPLLPEPAL